MMKEIFSSLWFWLIVFAHFGASNGTYLASKDERFQITKWVSYAVTTAVYVFIIILFWRMERWYTPVLVFLFVHVLSLLATAILGAIRSFGGGLVSSGERVFLTFAGLAAIVYSFFIMP